MYGYDRLWPPAWFLKATNGRQFLVAELLPRIDQIGILQVVESGNAPPAGCAGDPAQRFTTFDDVDSRAGSAVRRGVRAGGDGGFGRVQCDNA